MASYPSVTKPSTLYRRYRYQWRRVRRFVIHNVLHADDPPHKLALGAAIGMFVSLTPTGGFQMALVLFFAWLFRANKVIGIPLVWISNPVTAIPILWGSYEIGRICLLQNSIGAKWWGELLHPPESWWDGTMFYLTRFSEICWPLILGSVILGSVLAVVTYYLTYYSIRAYRIRRWGNPNGPKYIDKIPPFTG